MNRIYIWAILLGLGFIIFVSACNYNNSFVALDESVHNSWSKVQSAYQERADLIPNLVATVRGAADFEKGTLEAVINARSKATSITIDPSTATPEQIRQFQEAQNGLSQSLGRLLVVAEQYPDLKSNASFQQLQAQLEGQENRIRVERNRYNDTVTEYNTKIRRFPASFFASIFGFDRATQFEAQEGAQNAPKVEF